MSVICTGYECYGISYVVGYDVCGDEGMKRWHGTGNRPGRQNRQRHGLLETETVTARELMA